MLEPENLKGINESVEDKLLRLIEMGDATVILSPEYIESLNELMKREFITIENEKLQLTDKGRQAQIHGVKATNNPEIPVQEQVELYDFPAQKIGQVISKRAFIFILFFTLISLVITFTLVNTSSL